jgi:hypothetical protein
VIAAHTVKRYRNCHFMEDSRRDELPPHDAGGTGPLKQGSSRAVCQHLPADPLLAIGALDDLLAAVETAGAYMVTQMGFTGRWFDCQRRVCQEIVRPAHVAS